MKQTNFIMKAGKACFCKLVIVAMAVVTLCSSCCKDDPETGISYTVVCSADLLEFVTPEVTRTNTHGEQEKIVITENMWNKSDMSVSETNGTSISHTVQGYSWVKTVKYKSWGVNDKIEVNYIKKEGTTIDAIRVYRFCHGVDANVVTTNEDGFDKTTYVDVTVRFGEFINGNDTDAINAYINNVTQSTDHKQVKVDGNGGVSVQK